MTLADNKFKNLKLKVKWNDPSTVELKITALEAQINEMKKKTGRKQKKKTIGGKQISKYQKS